MTSDIFDDLFGGFEAMNRRFEALFSDLKDFDNVKTYGYTMYRGPDGVPHVYEYGNAVDEHHMIGENVNSPLTDVSQDGDTVRVTVEIPGVNKDEIVLEGTEESLRIASEGSRRFDKTVALPCRVDPDSASAVCNNGILEVTFRSKEVRPQGRRIEIR